MEYLEEPPDGISGRNHSKKNLKEFPEGSPVVNNLQMEFLEESPESLLKGIIRSSFWMYSRVNFQRNRLEKFIEILTYKTKQDN